MSTARMQPAKQTNPTQPSAEAVEAFRQMRALEGTLQCYCNEDFRCDACLRHDDLWFVAEAGFGDLMPWELGSGLSYPGRPPEFIWDQRAKVRTDLLEKAIAK